MDFTSSYGSVLSSDFPLSVRLKTFFFCLGRGKGAVSLLCFFASVPEKEISDFIAHGSIIRDFTYLRLLKNVKIPQSF